MIYTEQTQEPIKNNIKWGTIIPLFGGMSIGNKQAIGTDPEIFLSYKAFKENDVHVQNYMPNIPFELIDEDLINISNIPDNLDLISTVCPCAGLSMYSTHARKDADNPANDWMYKSANFVLENLKPKVFFGENAPGLYTDLGTTVRKNLSNIAEKHGYSFSIYKTNTMLHGIPQDRPRTFYFFWKSKHAPIFDWFNRKKKTVLEYLDEIPQEINDLSKTAWHMPGRKPSEEPMYVYINERFPDFFKTFDNNKNLSNVLLDKNVLEDYVQWITPQDDKYTKRDIYYANLILSKHKDDKGWFKRDAYIIKSENVVPAILEKIMVFGVHPTEDRGLTTREVFHLMGLPHDFVDNVDKFQIFRKIAQNVPVSTARDMTIEALKFLNNELEDSGTKFLMQDNVNQVLSKQYSTKVLF